MFILCLSLLYHKLRDTDVNNLKVETPINLRDNRRLFLARVAGLYEGTFPNISIDIALRCEWCVHTVMDCDLSRV